MSYRFIKTLIIRGLLASVMAFPLQAQKWEILETKGTISNRQENGFMSCKGKFYLIGGYGIMPVDIYDPGTGEWTRGAAPPVEMHHFQAVRYGTKIYVAGAFTGTYPDEKPLDHIYIYDTDSDTWEKGDPLPEDRRRGSAGVAIYREKMYIICGTRDQYKGDCTSWVDRYDLATGKWKKMADAPVARDDFHVATINGEIYAAGGRITSRRTGRRKETTIKQVDVYNVHSGRWRTLPENQDLPTPRAGCAAVAILDHLLIIGGENQNQDEAYKLVEALDPETGQWEQWGNLNEGRHGTQAFMCVGTVFISSGTGGREDKQALTTTEMLIF
jgi:hypothetical protein